MSGSSFSAAAAAVMAPPRPKYDVFLSFRGVDTRNNFTDHLHARLCKSNIKTFIDYKIDRGNKISDELYTGIEESMIYIIIFSPNYASSAWCLKELVKILECKEKYKRHVMPIFFKVTPATVKYQEEGSYADAFADHIKQTWFEEEEINKWKVALSETGDLKGTGVDDTRQETMILDGIVADVLKKLNRSFSSTVGPGLVGIEEHISEIQSKLQLESEDVRTIGIWGMGGIGKTTLAQELHNNLVTRFNASSCIIHARQQIERDGIDSLRTKILSELLDEAIPSNGLQFAIERVNRAPRVLLILDDLKDSDQVEKLFGGHKNFSKGSRIIVTSRDKHVLNNANADAIYEVQEMNFQDSQKLFSLHAFKQNCPFEAYADLVDQVLKYAQGVPLALKVLGTLLHGKTREVWESELKKLKKYPNVNIFSVLKLSYDGLDRDQKDIFLDIACFYAGDFVDKVVQMLDGCGFYANSGMDVLKDRCLISILKDRITVHDLIQEMGKEIVHQQCDNDPGKCSRLWKYEDIFRVLRKNKGTDRIQCIFLDICRIKKVQLHPTFFKSMDNLRMLYFYRHSSLQDVKKWKSNVIIPNVLESLPDSLKVLHWDEFPQKSLSLDFYPENLVELQMRHSHLEQLWENDEELPNLKRLDLSHSWKLIRLPNLSKSLNIEEIVLSGCEALTSLPVDLCKLKLLRRLDLNRCKKLDKFPEIKETMENLAVLVLDETAIQELPSSLHRLVGLKELSLQFCLNLESLPNSIGILNLLSELNCYGCGKLTRIPYSIGGLSSLRKLSLQDTGIMNLPESIADLSNLELLISVVA